MDHGIILGFQQKVRFDLCFTSHIPLFQENRVFPDYCIFAKFHHAQGISAVESLLWNPCCGISAVESLLWNPCCGSPAVESLLWNPCCGLPAVESLQWNPCCGILAVAPRRHPGGTQEASRRHPRGTLEAPRAPRRPEVVLEEKSTKNIVFLNI